MLLFRICVALYGLFIISVVRENSKLKIGFATPTGAQITIFAKEQ